MASEIVWRHAATGITLYATIHTRTPTYWNTGGTPNFETLTVANWTSYAVAMTETPSASYLYVGTFPAISGNMVVGWYFVDVYLRAGASAAISDTLLVTLYGYWNGTVFDWGAANTVQVNATNQTASDLGASLTSGFSTVNNNIGLISTNDRRCSVVIPDEFYIPAAGSKICWVDVYLKDADGNPFDPVGGVTVHAWEMDGTDLDARLTDVNGNNPGTTTLVKLQNGWYRAYVKVNSTDTSQPVSFSGSYAEGAVTKRFGGTVNLESLTDQAKIQSIYDQTLLIATDGGDSPAAKTAQANQGTPIALNANPATLAGMIVAIAEEQTDNLGQIRQDQ